MQEKELLLSAKSQKLKRISYVFLPFTILIILTIIKLNFTNFTPFTIPHNLTRSDPYLTYQLATNDPLLDKIGQPDLNPSHKHLHEGSKAMVASDVPLCSTMGKNILLKGGNAADAAVTVALCIGSINSHSSGIGGGGFILSKKGEKVISIDAREMAPTLAYKEMYGSSEILSKIGGLAIAIPGELKGLYDLYKLHGSGKLTWKQLFAPIIELNYKGWKCSKIFEVVVAKENELVLSKVPSLKQMWDFIFNESGDLIKEGDFIRRPNYAKTLSIIANNGSSDVFYDPTGPIVPSLVNTITKWGGIISPEDFAKYHTIIEEPLTTTIDKFKVYTSNGISSGLSLIAGLNFFHSIYNPSDSDILYNHKLIESFKWSSSVRTRLGDKSNQKQEVIKKFTGLDWISETNYSDNQTFTWENYDPKYDLVEPQGTSHFAIVDENGDSVAMTTTVNLLFGSMIYDKNTGIILNDEMDDFSQPNVSNAFNLTPSIYNFVHPGKRPLSSTAPTIITYNDKVDFVIGAAGGSRITNAVLQAIIRVYYKNLSLLKTISYPRLHHQLIPQSLMCENITTYEEEYPGEEILKHLKEKNHTFLETGSLTAMNGIKRLTNGKLQGVSDYWRKRGEADGY
ncbi:uncharacterized protein KGF55_004191 [Candida pseudojiufengensis]|uniref:uncharacterized protein n=1 Tax=Candida pseudojiufengensis TaxID=497109 RepID=UPI0022253B10|nr:uncharacterized protein KGF55_004191 [Candida pseudojiufengensis]KAI5961266.1 hypothetical protein KGF55_004191 [Candida pseudojiufengensis]